MYIVFKENQYFFVVNRNNTVIGIAFRLQNDRYKRRSPFFLQMINYNL